MTKAEIESELEDIIQAVRLRMEDVGPTMIGLLPTEFDWMTPEERARQHELKLQLPSYGQEAMEAKARLKEKRRKRLELLQKGVKI
jgi:hypothetical protein